MSEEMKNDVFISYSSQNLQFAHAICNYMEHAGIRCWYAPRNITPGKPWAGEIYRGIASSKVFVLVLSPDSNRSDQVLREVNLAVDNKLHVITFIVENTDTSADLKYYISSVHWIDAISKPIEENLNSLVAAVSSLLNIKTIYKAQAAPAPVTTAEVYPEKPRNIVIKSAVEAFKHTISNNTEQIEHNQNEETKIVTLENYNRKHFFIRDKELCEYKADEKNVIIPGGIVSINKKAFKNKSLTYVTIPNTVTHIHNEAFCSCKNLLSLNLPSSVVEIGFNAFDGCESLTNVKLPNRITTIADHAFTNCSNLTNLILPKGITKILNGAFSGCENITEIIFPENISKIERFAFSGCNGLKNVVLPLNLKAIGEFAFANCTNLKKITIPGSVEEIENCAFSNCTELTIICSKGSVADVYATAPNKLRHGNTKNQKNLPIHKVEYI